LADAPVHRPDLTPAAPAAEPAAPVAAPVAAPIAAEPAAPAQPAAPEIKRADAAPSLLEADVAKPDAPAPAEPAAAEPSPDAPKPEGEKPTEPAPAVDPAKPAEPAPVAAEPVKPQPLKYENFTLPDEVKLPDGIQLDQKRVDEVGAIFAEHQVPEPIARSLLGKHVAAMNEFRAATVQNQHDVFAKWRADRRAEIMADPVLGGAGHQTAMARVARMRDMVLTGKTEAETTKLRNEFNEFARLTGAGDHPVFARMLYNFGAMFDEPAPAPIPANPAPDRGGNAKRGAAGRYNHSSYVAARQRNGA
jgi:hypothetical protein